VRDYDDEFLTVLTYCGGRSEEAVGVQGEGVKA
jgi:hypothetical protein